MKRYEWYNPVIPKLQRAGHTQMFNHRIKKKTNKQTIYVLQAIC